MTQDTQQPNSQPWQQRDGTSQADRRRPALDPNYVAVDERSLKDLLRFAREYARELHYYDVEAGRVQSTGDWSGFLGNDDKDIDLDELVAFMEEPDRFPPEQVRRYGRPHLALFLTFLQLLRHAQAQLNTLTRRHLDFYYHQVLRMARRAGIPDQVNVLVDLAAGTAQFPLPAGTLLTAGPDSQGQARLYRTERDVVLNRAQVARLSAVYAERRVTGIREAREAHEGPDQEKVLRMLEIALGQPRPGDPLPPYETGETVDYAYLLALQQIVTFVPNDLFMSFPDFRSLMRLKQNREQADAEWNQINAILEKAGQTRLNDPTYRLNPADPRDFEANLRAALGNPADFDTIFAGIPEVDDIYDAYRKRERADLKDDIQQRVAARLFLGMADFVALMQLKVRIDNEWAEINRLLEAAGQNKRQQSYSLPASADPTAFETNLADALGPLTFPNLPAGGAIQDIDQLHQQILAVERYFFTSAQNFAYLMDVAENPQATAQAWANVYTLLAEAHRQKVYADRRAQLRQIRETDGFEAMIAFAAGDDSAASSATALERLLENVVKAEDKAFLRQIEQDVAAGAPISDAAWASVYRLVELTLRGILPEPVAQKVDWLNLYPAADVTTMTVELGLEAAQDTPRWKTFGQRPPAAAEDNPPPSPFGWAISSPLLALSQGRRTITLRLVFQPEAFDYQKISNLLQQPGGGPFQLEVSSEAGWLAAGGVTTTLGHVTDQAPDRFVSGIPADQTTARPALQFELTLAENIEPLTPPPAEEAAPQTPWPLLRLMLRQIWQPKQGQHDIDRYITHYQPFRELALRQVQLSVAVTGLIPQQLQNDETALTPTKPFEPFGSQAAAGARFYVGHPELVYKKLTRLAFQIDWMGLPADLKGHYANYPAVNDAASFTTAVSLVDQRLELPLASKARLFATARGGNTHTISVPDVPAAIEAGRPGYPYQRLAGAVLANNLPAWPRYVQWELNAPDFQHDAYPTLAVQKSVELAAAIAKSPDKVDPAKYQVNPPYTPKIKSLSLDYTAAVTIDLAAYEPGAQLDRIFHIHPFGFSEIQPEAKTQTYRFLPRYDHEGELYIGIRDVQPPQNLSLLFQLAEGSADPDLAPVPIQWSYLSGNRWLSLEDGQLLQDTSRGLINSGIITVALPPGQPSNLLPSGLTWLRAAIPRHSNSVCDTVGIHAQAVAAAFVDHDNAPDHLSRPLPPHSITDLAEPLPEIAAIRQPYTSFGGKMPEQDRTFYTRTSERLRHKQRALTPWDYEHMVLERFPELHKAKCLPAQADQPGQVTVVVIPDIKNKLPFNPFAPKAPANLIVDIERFLAAHTPAWAAVAVKNAHYVPVKLRFGVRFRPGYDEGFYKQQLNEELNRFLSPWAYEESAEIVIGGRIYANVIINFIEERPYVDYVAQIKLFKSEDGQRFTYVSPGSASEGYWTAADGPAGVLVAARQHEIDLITAAGYEAEDFTGINYMKIELDFVVG